MTTTLDRPGAEKPGPLAPLGDAQLTLTLDASERLELRTCEATIERNLSAFIETGAALLIIKDSRLYRETHASFESYLAERWNMGKTSAYRLIKAAEVVAGIENIGAPVSRVGEAVLPANEAQARPLSALPEDQRAEAWAKAVEAAEGRPTAAEVQAAVDEMLPPKEERPPAAAQLIQGQFDAYEQEHGDTGQGAQNGFAPSGPVPAGDVLACEQPEGASPEGASDGEGASAKSGGPAGALAALNAERDASVKEWTSAPSEDAPSEDGAPAPPQVALDTQALDQAAAVIEGVKPEGVKPVPAAPRPLVPVPAPKPAPAENPILAVARKAGITTPERMEEIIKAATATPTATPGWTTAFVKVDDFEKAKRMGLWPLSETIREVEDLRAAIAAAGFGSPSEMAAAPAPDAQVEAPVSPAMALAGGAASRLAEMIREGQDILTLTDRQLLDELFPTRTETLPEHVVATLVTKRLRQASGDIQTA